MTIGNIPKEIRRKPSSRAYVLLAYLPTTRLENEANKSARRRLLANLYHACMKKILGPLVSAGADGIVVACGRGNYYRGHPIMASFSGDYPEQCLTTCVKNGECPTCDAPRDNLGDQVEGPTRHRDLDRALALIDSFDDHPEDFLKNCEEAGIRPIIQPFWKDLPYTDIYRSITPDILHQLYQGLIKHLVAWLIEIFGPAEIDARCRRFPPNHNIRIFSKGISSLSRVTGQEHDQISRFILGTIIDAPLPGQLSPIRLLRAVRGLLDFLYLAQYPVHTDETLDLLDDALSRFHANKEIFVVLGVREHFNIPKFHWAQHYSETIRLYGTPDNFNTEYTERLHIDLTKDAYAATNFKDEFEQMTTWLERKEKILRHDQFVKWRLSGSPNPPDIEWSPPGLELDRQLQVSKHPSRSSVPIENLVQQYGATHFVLALQRYVAALNYPDFTSARLEREVWNAWLPFTRLPVWHKVRFRRTDPYTNTTTTADAVHARPASSDRRRRPIPARFDPAYINTGDGEVTGMDGYRVGRVRVIFSLPVKAQERLFNAGVQCPELLAYVEWYTPIPAAPDPNTLLYKISTMEEEGGHICSIIPLSDIRRSVHLYPKFGPSAPVEWTSSTVLDLCKTFHISSFTDRNFYRIIA
ncbi:hypothetical protein CC2G_004422 [Coprinopsis cinerea AmutBmut pab1-1]|nr:hypothetical protein CC2G_004422 [Coprinopsis cinerea AmutBmut pab1-1]